MLVCLDQVKGDEHLQFLSRTQQQMPFLNKHLVLFSISSVFILPLALITDQCVMFNALNEMRLFSDFWLVTSGVNCALFLFIFIFYLYGRGHSFSGAVKSVPTLESGAGL